MSALLRRWRYWRQRAARGQALREEIDLHLAEAVDELEAAGLSAEQARAEARRRFGNLARPQEEAREIWFTRFASELAQDLRYGLRTLGSNRAFSALAVLSLALGIGANTAIYSLMESILLRSLPVEEPESLVLLNWQSQAPQNANRDWVHVMHSVSGLLWKGDQGTMLTGMFPYAAFEQFSAESPVFSTVFGYYNGRTRSLALNGQAVSVPTEFVTGGYFAGLRVSAAAGRLLTPADDRPGAPPAAVISHALSERRFGGPAAAIGQPVLVDNVPFTIIGVTPPEFFGVDPAIVPDLYLPLHATLLIDSAAAASREYHDENHYWIEMMGRLRPGISMEQAQAALRPSFTRWVASTAKSDGERARLPVLVLNPGAGGLGSLRREYSKPLWVLFAMVALILVLTCANLANLLLAKATARRREMAVRLSLGAGRFRVVRQLLTESVLLAGLGGTLGILVSIWGARTLTLLFSRGREGFTLHAELNWNVLAVTAGLSLVCGLLFGLAPALQATRPDLMAALMDGRWGGARRRGQALLIIGQMAVSFLIVVAAGLFVSTLNQLHSVQLGYNRENLLLFTINAAQGGHTEPERTAFYSSLRERLEAMSGVRGATYAQASLLEAPMAGGAPRGPIRIGAVTVDGASVMVTGPGYLSTLEAPLLAGRAVEPRDQAGTAPVAVISERLARTYFPEENPIGRRLTLVNDHRDLEIIGVAGNLRYGGLKSEGPMTIFVAAAQFPPERATFTLRTAGDPLSYVPGVEAILRQADPRLPVTRINSQTGEIDRTINREITFARLCAGFALLALAIAGVGVFGTMSYSVSRQISEIGIRMALGARRGAVVWMVLRRVLLLAAAGLAVSLPVIWAGAGVLQSLLYGVRPTDPRTLAAAAAILVGAALAAGYGPARRASRIDPLVALRHE